MGTEVKLQKLDELYGATKRFCSCREFIKMLEYCRRMRYLTPYNAALAWLQKPDARIMLSAKKWTTYDRVIRDEAKPALILLPFSPIDFVFDIDDTAPLNNPLWSSDDDLLAHIRHQLIPKGNDINRVQWDNLSFNMALYGILEEKNENADRKVSVLLNKDKRSTKYKALYVIPDSGKQRDNNKAHNLFRDISHLLCHHIPAPDGKEWAARRLTETARAFESETVSKLVCDHIGIKCCADEYLAVYANCNESVPKGVNPDYVLAAAAEIIQMLQGKIQPEKSLLFKFSKDFERAVISRKKRTTRQRKTEAEEKPYPTLPFE